MRKYEAHIPGNGLRYGNERAVRHPPTSAVGFGAPGALSVVVFMGGKNGVWHITYG